MIVGCELFWTYKQSWIRVYRRFIREILFDNPSYRDEYRKTNKFHI